MLLSDLIYDDPTFEPYSLEVDQWKDEPFDIENSSLSKLLLQRDEIRNLPSLSLAQEALLASIEAEIDVRVAAVEDDDPPF